MIFSVRHIAWLTVIVTGLLTACKTTHTTEEKPAVIMQNSQAVQDALAMAVSKAVGAKVTLAPDSFVTKPSITIEPPSVNKRNGQIIDGRSQEMPTHIDLVMKGQNCFVLNRDTGDKYPLKGVRCQAFSKG